MEAVANLTMEILQVADTVARDKGIGREQVLEAMEQAIQKAGRTKYGLEHDIRATIDRAPERGEALAPINDQKAAIRLPREHDIPEKIARVLALTG